MEIGTRQNRSAPSRWKNWCGLDRQENIEIARRAAAHARFAFAREADAGAFLDARRDVDRQGAFAGDAAGAAASGARIVDDFAAPMAVVTGALDREEPLRRAHAPAPPQVGHCLGFEPGLAPLPEQDLAGDGGRDLELGGLAQKGFLEGDLKVVAHVGAALASAAASRGRRVRGSRRRNSRRCPT